MTAHKHLKQLVRARIQKTGESYASARRQVIRQAQQTPRDPAVRWHFPGNVPAATALRVLLAQAGVRAPHTGEPFTEAMLFGIAGGIGAGVFSFYYEKEDFASFFIAGRHLWQDDAAYLTAACKRLALKPVCVETAGVKGAERQLRELLEHGPCIAWVDAAELPHRAMPAMWSGGGYHLITVYRTSDDGTVLVGDLTDEPIAISMADLARARGRIKKFKNRLLAIREGDSPHDLAPLVKQGLQSCYDGLQQTGRKGSATNFSLEALRVWADRMQGDNHAQSWERVFRPGANLWRGLISIYDFIEHYGTGGGLCRPLFADFLSEAAEHLSSKSLRALSQRYAELGTAWSALAAAALPEDVPLMREAKQLHARKAELVHSGGPAASDEMRAVWERLEELAAEAGQTFPLSNHRCADLRARLQPQIMALYEAEVAAHAELGRVAQSL